ncbi:helix-loop-helix DNA-binding domain-containing protein [Gongronella butleri]|nr:helix-loop-helix DNA-binding domain-containing protein [Gongronella butleri]
MNMQDTVHPLAISGGQNSQAMPASMFPTSPPLDDPNLFISPTLHQPPSSFDEFEDLDYQSGMMSYQKQHGNERHFSMAMPIQVKPEAMQDSFGASYDAIFPMSAPADYRFTADVMPSSSYSPIHTSPTLGGMEHHPMDSPSSMAKSYDDDEYAVQVNMQKMMEKRRRRRESHNAVERRRRENINDRIQELGRLLPDITMHDTTNQKLNKGSILRQSVDHIRHLQQEVRSYADRIRELENTLKQLQAK